MSAPDYPALLEAIRTLLDLPTPTADSWGAHDREMAFRGRFVAGFLHGGVPEEMARQVTEDFLKRAAQPLPYTPRPAEAGSEVDIEVSGKPGTARQAIAEVHAMLGEGGAS